jgi:hypothetical protein
MAIVSAREIWEGRTATIDDKGHREYTREFRFTTNADTDDAATICLSPLIPPLYTPYVVPNGFDTGALLTRISTAQEQGEPTVWKVTLHYSTRSHDASRHPGNPNPSSADQFSQSPFDRPPLITWDAVQYTRPLVKDVVTSKPVLNSAGERFDPPPEIDDSRIVLIYERNEPVYDSNVAVSYRDSVNSDTWNGFDPGTVKLSKISANLEYEKGVFYWRVRYEFHIRDNWQVSLLDHGSKQLTNDNPPLLVHIISKSGGIIDDLLDGNGKQLPPTNPASDRFANAVFKTYNAYTQIAFAPLQITVPG